MVLAAIIVVVVIVVDVASNGLVANAAGGGGATTAQSTPPQRLSYFTKAGYGVDVFECDADLNPLPRNGRQKKKPGTTYRVCFRPNQAAIDADVGIEKIDDWYWDTTYDGGYAELHAVKGGKSDGALSSINCKPDGSICRLDTMLPSNFHLNPGSVVGEGRATLSSGHGQVFMHQDLFQGEFKFEMPEAPEEKIREYMEMYKAAQKAEAAAGETEAAASTEESKTSTTDESSGEDDPSGREL